MCFDLLAYAAFQEEQKGSIEVGKWADLVVLSDDIMTIAPGRIPATRVEKTLVGGLFCRLGVVDGRPEKSQYVFEIHDFLTPGALFAALFFVALACIEERFIPGGIVPVFGLAFTFRAGNAGEVLPFCEIDEFHALGDTVQHGDLADADADDVAGVADEHEVFVARDLPDARDEPDPRRRLEVEDALAAALLELADADRRSSLCAASLERVQQNFTDRALAGHLARIFQSVRPEGRRSLLSAQGST